MLYFPINYDLIGGEMRGYYQFYNEHPPSTLALATCMMATGCYRIFDKTQMEEFLYRLPIVLNNTKLVDNWFTDGFLFTYKYKEQLLKFSISDLEKNLGIQIAERIKPAVSRSELFSNLYQFRVRLRIYNYFTEMQVPPIDFDEPEDIIVEDIDFSEDAGQKPKSLMIARFFADDITGNIQPEVFNHRNEALVKKEAEYEFRLKDYQAKRNFDGNSHAATHDILETDPFIDLKGISRIAFCFNRNKNQNNF